VKESKGLGNLSGSVSGDDPLKNTEYAPLNGRLLTLPGDPAQQPSREKLGVHWAVFRGDVA
jgi:hypothetical protein